jgi:hypothetical protein
MLNLMHAAYGVGAASGPLLMTSVLRGGHPWQLGYAIVAAGQLTLGATFAASRSMWPERPHAGDGEPAGGRMPIVGTLGLANTWLGVAGVLRAHEAQSGRRGMGVLGIDRNARAVDGARRDSVSACSGRGSRSVGCSADSSSIALRS